MSQPETNMTDQDPIPMEIDQDDATLEVITSQEVTETNLETDPETDPETGPETDPETNPGTDPETVPGTNPETNQGTDPEPIPEYFIIKVYSNRPIKRDYLLEEKPFRVPENFPLTSYKINSACLIYLGPKIKEMFDQSQDKILTITTHLGVDYKGTFDLLFKFIESVLSELSMEQVEKINGYYNSYCHVSMDDDLKIFENLVASFGIHQNLTFDKTRQLPPTQEEMGLLYDFGILCHHLGIYTGSIASSSWIRHLNIYTSAYQLSDIVPEEEETEKGMYYQLKRLQYFEKYPEHPYEPSTSDLSKLEEIPYSDVMELQGLLSIAQEKERQSFEKLKVKYEQFMVHLRSLEEANGKDLKDASSIMPIVQDSTILSDEDKENFHFVDIMRDKGYRVSILSERLAPFLRKIKEIEKNTSRNLEWSNLLICIENSKDLTNQDKISPKLFDALRKLGYQETTTD